MRNSANNVALRDVLVGVGGVWPGRGTVSRSVFYVPFSCLRMARVYSSVWMAAIAPISIVLRNTPDCGMLDIDSLTIYDG